MTQVFENAILSKNLLDYKEAEIKKLMELQEHRTDVQFDVMQEIIRGQKEAW